MSNRDFNGNNGVSCLSISTITESFQAQQEQEKKLGFYETHPSGNTVSLCGVKKANNETQASKESLPQRETVPTENVPTENTKATRETPIYTVLLGNSQTTKDAVPSNGVKTTTTTLEDHASHSQPNKFAGKETPLRIIVEVLVASIVALVHLGEGCTFGFPSVSLNQLTEPDSGDIYLTPVNAALFGSIVSIGAVFGGLTSGPFIARLGLRTSLLILLPLTLGLWLLKAFSSSVLLLISSRVLLGFMSASITAASNTYILEIASKNRRGTLFAMTIINRQMGNLFVYSLGNSTLSWRHMALICGAVTTVIPFIGLIFFPESPRWLVTRGRKEDAKKSLTFFRGENSDCQSELAAIIQDVNGGGSKETSSQWRQLLKGSSLKIMFSLSLLTILATSDASFPLTIYFVPIFQNSSLPVNVYTAAISMSAMRTVGTLVYLALADRVRRRYIYLTSFSVMCVVHALLGGYFYIQTGQWVTYDLGWLPLTCVLVYAYFLSVGQPVLYTLHGELLPTNIRSIGMSLLVGTIYIGGFLTTQLHYTVADALGTHSVFWMYSFGCFTVVVLSYFILPDTTGLSLEEINAKTTKKDNSI